MSYILDALRKADAERRGVPPPPTGLTEPAVLMDNDPDADLPAGHARPWAWVLGGVAIALVAAGGWTLWRGDAPPVTVVAAAPPQVAPAPALPPGPAPVPEPNVDVLPHFPPPLPEAPKPEAPKAEPRPVLTPTPPPPPPPSAKPLPPGIAIVPPVATPGEVGNRIYKVSELPEDVRRDFPKFSVNGAMYSERAADRMVVFNGQIFHEGDALGKGVMLKQIRLKSTVLEFRGYRIEVGH